MRRRARLRGQSLTGYIEEMLERELARPPREEIFARIAKSEAVSFGRAGAEIIRRERRRREKHLATVLRATRR